MDLLTKVRGTESSRNPFHFFFPCLSCKTCSNYLKTLLWSDILPTHNTLMILIAHETQVKFLCLIFKALHPLPWPTYLVFPSSWPPHSRPQHKMWHWKPAQLCAMTLLERAWLEAHLSALHVWNVPWAIVLYSHFIFFQCLPPPFVYPDLVICK